MNCTFSSIPNLFVMTHKNKSKFSLHLILHRVAVKYYLECNRHEKISYQCHQFQKPLVPQNDLN